MVQSAADLELGSFTIEAEHEVIAPPERVWDALVNDIGCWWGYRIAEGESTIHFEPRVGGRLYEDWVGGGALWGIVTHLRQTDSVRIEGSLGIKTAVQGLLELSFVRRPAGTLVRLRHQAFGLLDPRSGEAHEEGWTYLLGTCLRRYVEEGLTWERLAAASA